MDKNKKRGERRDKTLRYQNRQIKAFLRDRSGYYTTARELTDKEKGHFRRHNPFDCGNSNCCMCRNIRRVAWYPKLERLTFSERRNLDTFLYQCDHLDIPKNKIKK
jgi:hypothetical protein